MIEQETRAKAASGLKKTGDTRNHSKGDKDEIRQLHRPDDFHSPLGEMLIAATDKGLAGTWFDGQRHLPPQP
jgi:hypothetical protein